MSRIFLSHSSQDNDSAVALRDWLSAHGWDDVFLDLDPRRGISAGSRWQRSLNQAALRCEGVLFLVSRAWLGSDWCLKEFNLAHRLNKRLFGLLIEDVSIGDLPATLTENWQLVALSSGRDHVMLRAILPGSQNEAHVTFSQEGLIRLRIGLERAGLDARFFENGGGRDALPLLAFTLERLYAAYGECDPEIPDSGYGRGQQPVINVTWYHAQQYVAWLSKMTGKTYRLLTEAEYEYAARGGTQTAFPWGNEVGSNNANCVGCGSAWDRKQPAPVGSFPPNRFGLVDMVGNVFQWVADCVHPSYQGAPTNGSAWVDGGKCTQRIVRGDCWFYNPIYLRSASRLSYAADTREDGLGFRVARTLMP